MDKAFWLARWEQNQIGFHLDEVNAHLENFWPRLGLSNGTVFVPLCGKSLDMPWLLSQGHRVIGVEISEIAVRDFFVHHGLEPRRSQAGPFESWRADGIELLCGDFFDLSAARLEGVTAVYDRASLVALPKDMRAAYAAHLKRILPVAVPILLVSLEYDQKEMSGPPFSVHEEEVRMLYADSYAVEVMFDAELIADNPGLAARGVTSLREKVYQLLPDG